MEFAELLDKVRAGDRDAWTIFLRDYAPDVLQAVRCGLRDPVLRRVYGPSDILQSVLLKLLGTDGLEAAGPDELCRLLRAMARRRLVDKARIEKGRSASRGRVQAAGPGVLEAAVAGDAGPDRVAADRDEVRAVKDRLPPAERTVFELRVERGWGWGRVAAHLGGATEALKKRFRRALDCVGHTTPCPSEFATVGRFPCPPTARD